MVIKMKFTKMHGIGNDYIIFLDYDFSIDNPSLLAQKLCDRHFGIGSDGLIILTPSSNADIKMRIFNVDGSEAEMCGNAIRCVAKYVSDNDIISHDSLLVETKSGLKKAQIISNDKNEALVKINMGSVQLESDELNSEHRYMIMKPAIIDDDTYYLNYISVGNPHCVVYTDDLEHLDINHIGPIFEHNPIFKNRVNTEFVKVLDHNTLKMRVWERGVGETLGCGTGACAALVSSSINNLTDNHAKVILKGGILDICWDKINNLLFMTGSANYVYDGKVDVKSYKKL